MDVSPGIIHVEEACEALLSKLDRAVKRHPATVTHAQYTDVFLGLPAARNVEHCRTRVPAFVLDNFRDRIQHLLRTSFIPPSVRWSHPKNRNTVTVASLSYVSPGYLRPLTEPLQGTDVRRVLRECLLTLVCGRAYAVDTIPQFTNVFPARQPDAVAREQQDIDNVLRSAHTAPAHTRRRRRLSRTDEMSLDDP